MILPMTGEITKMNQDNINKLSEAALVELYLFILSQQRQPESGKKNSAPAFSGSLSSFGVFEALISQTLDNRFFAGYLAFGILLDIGIPEASFIS